VTFQPRARVCFEII